MRIYPWTFVAALSASLFASHADAAGTKGYPGATCQVDGSSPPIDRYYGRAYNTSSARQVFECPIVRDVDTTLNVSGGVYVVDQNFNEEVGCQLTSCLSSTSSVACKWSSRSSTGTSTTPQWLSFATISDIGHSYMSCGVPGVYSSARSAIVAYDVEQE